jgi:c-di-AMP phosphodiesterase-like protein
MFCGVECHIIVDTKNENFKVSTEGLASISEYEHIFIDGASAIDLLTPSTLLVIVDANNFKIIEAPEIAERAKTIYVIDHHRQNDEMPSNVISPPYIDPAASSACELVAEILEQGVPGGTLRKEEANVMLSGIMVDTKNFTRTTSTRTFGAALYLRGEGANSEIARTFFNEEFDSYLAEAKFGSDVITYRQRIAITKSDGTDSPADRVAAAKAADKLLTVRGIDAAFALVSIGESVNISARSNGKINVQIILEGLGGGGHFDAAGAQMNSIGMREASERLKEAIDSYLDNINK